MKILKFLHQLILPKYQHKFCTHCKPLISLSSFLLPLYLLQSTFLLYTNPHTWHNYEQFYDSFR